MTEKQKEVLPFLITGTTMRVTGEALGLRRKGLEYRVSAVYAHHGVRSRDALIGVYAKVLNHKHHYVLTESILPWGNNGPG